MDKLKAIQYFLAAAQSGSLSAAARQQGVSLQAVAKLVSALEAELGATLFQRGSRGLQLTADGAQYAEACSPLLAQLQAADDGVRQARQRPQGPLVVGGTPFLLQHCIVPALSAFHASYPDLTLDLRAVLHLEETAAKDCDLLLLHGWFEAGGWVRRELPVMAQVTAATPEYWKRQGFPRHPRDLALLPLFTILNTFMLMPIRIWGFMRMARNDGWGTRKHAFEGEQTVTRQRNPWGVIPYVLAATMMIFIPTVGDYVTPLMVGGPDGLMIANAIGAQFGKSNNWPLGSALSLTSMVLVSVVALAVMTLGRRTSGSAA